MANLPMGGPAAGGGGRRYRRGYLIPDVRELMGIRVNKVQPRDGNLNSEANQVQTPTEKFKLFTDFLQSHGVSEKEFANVFESNTDQGEEINGLNVHVGAVFEEWAGLRREYYYLMLILKKNPKEMWPQLLGNMKSIMRVIEHLKIELSEITADIKSRNGYPLPKPDVFDEEMVNPKVEKAKKTGRRK